MCRCVSEEIEWRTRFKYPALHRGGGSQSCPRRHVQAVCEPPLTRFTQTKLGRHLKATSVYYEAFIYSRGPDTEEQFPRIDHFTQFPLFSLRCVAWRSRSRAEPG